MEEEKIIYKDLSYTIVGVMYDIYNELGYGYKEKFYERAIGRYFTINDIKFKCQVPYLIAIKGKIIGRCYLDFLVEEKIIVEIKIGDYFSKRNINQVKEYLKVTGLKLALIVNYTHYGVKVLRILNPNYKESMNS